MSLEAKVFNLDGKSTETMTLSERVFSAKINKGLLHSAVIYYLGNRRAGSASTKTKSEVRGGGRKPYAQKHTGRARRGSSRSPLMVGGGVSMGPKPKSFVTKLTKSMKSAAMRSALTDKRENMIIVNNFDIKDAKTKSVIKVMDNFKMPKGGLFVDVKLPVAFARASSNISTIKAIEVATINVYEVLKYNQLFITKEAVTKLEELLG